MSTRGSGERADVLAILEDLRFSLERLYQDRNLHIQLSGLRGCRYRGEAEDLEEMPENADGSMEMAMEIQGHGVFDLGLHQQSAAFCFQLAQCYGILDVGLQLGGQLRALQQAADAAVELAVFLRPGAGELVQPGPGVGVDEQKRFVFLLQVLEHPHQHRVLEHVGVITGMAHVAVPQHRARCGWHGWAQQDAAQSYSVYFFALPRTRSAGYLCSLMAILRSTAPSRSTPSRSASLSR